MSYVVEWRTKTQEELINRVKSNLDTIKMNFFEIGGYLYEAYNRRFYRGYASITEFAKENFGFEKTMTYDLINVFRMFRDGDSYLPHQSVTHLNQTQLVALCSCQAGRNEFATIISPHDTVKDVKRAVKIFNKIPICARGSIKANNLKEFFEEFDSSPETNSNETTSEDEYEIYSEEKQDNFSVQTENKLQTLFDLHSNFTDAKLLQSYIENAISNLSEAANLCVLGGSFRNEVISFGNKLKALLDRFLHDFV